MILSLKSTGPDYNRIRTNLQIPWNCEYIEYYVESVNIRDVLVMTDDDEIGFKIHFNDYVEDFEGAITFDNSYHMGFKSKIKPALELDINTNGVHKIMNVNRNSAKQVVITPNVDLMFTNITRLAGFATGMYNVKPNEVLHEGTTYTLEKPIHDFYNKLYLVSKQGKAIQSNIGNEEYTPSIIASIDHPIREGTPIIYNFEMYGKPIKNIVNIDSFKQIELELVDFEYQPVKLMSPMFVTIKVNPCENPRMKLL